MHVSNFGLVHVALHVAPASWISAGHKDDRKGISETRVSRKSRRVLVAVALCLQIIAIRPMYASESLTQVFFSGSRDCFSFSRHWLLSSMTMPVGPLGVWQSGCGSARCPWLRVRPGRNSAVPSGSLIGYVSGKPRRMPAAVKSLVRTWS